MNFLKALSKSLFPQRCAYCGKVTFAGTLACSDCKSVLPRIKGKVCATCGREDEFCCCKGEKYFVSQAAPFYYEGVVRRGLHVFKFRKGEQNAEAYCGEMEATVRNRYGNVAFDCVVSVPMTESGVRKRGYNQVDILCKNLAPRLNLPYEKDALVKLYETEKQHGISYLFRKGNLTGVFDVPEPERINGKTVLLCDDISTSGETLNECAKMLWLNGAKDVYCISVALTKQNKKRR